MLLTELLPIDHIRIPLDARSRDEVLCELVDLVMAGASNEKRLAVQRAVAEREAVLSTGIGYGVAIPHGKTGLLTDLCMAAGRTAQPIEFDALDCQPVQLFFLLIGPEAAAGPHIKALSRISRIVRRDDVRDQLFSAPDAATFLHTLQKAED